MSTPYWLWYTYTSSEMSLRPPECFIQLWKDILYIHIFCVVNLTPELLFNSWSMNTLLHMDFNAGMLFHTGRIVSTSSAPPLTLECPSESRRNHWLSLLLHFLLHNAGMTILTVLDWADFTMLIYFIVWTYSSKEQRLYLMELGIPEPLCFNVILWCGPLYISAIYSEITLHNSGKMHTHCGLGYLLVQLIPNPSQ